MNQFLNTIHEGFDKIKTFAATRKGKITLSVSGCAVVALIITGFVAGSIPRNSAVAAGTSSKEDTTPVSSDVSSVSSEDVSISSIDSAASASSSTSTSEAPAASSTPTTTTVAQAPVPVTDISITKSSITVQQGATYQLTAVITPDNASDKTLSWTSTNTSIATVDGNGVVTGKAAGSATIHASGANGHKGTCKVTVKAQGNNDAPSSSVPSSSTPSSAGGVPADWNDIRVYPGTNPGPMHFTDEITGLTQTVEFKGVGAGHSMVAVGGANLVTTADYGEKYQGPGGKIVLSGTSGKTYDSFAVIARSGSPAGSLTFGTLTPGYYTLETIAADGHTAVAKIHFTVNSDGTVS